MSKTYTRRHTKLDSAEVVASMQPGVNYTIRKLAETHKISQASMQIVVGLIEVAGKIEACGNSPDGRLFRLKSEQPKFVTAKVLDMGKMYGEVNAKCKSQRAEYRSYMPIIEGKK